MFRNFRIAVFAVSGFLLAYCIVISFENLYGLALIMFAISPFLVGWLVYRVIRHGTYDGRELGEGEEFGYEDRSKDSLGIF